VPNGGAGCWGILLIRDAPYRGNRHLIAQCEGVVDEIKKSAQDRGKKKGLAYAGELLPRKLTS
jgi:hypothetical protein